VYPAAGVERLDRPGLPRKAPSGRPACGLFLLAIDVAKKRVAAQLQNQAPRMVPVLLPARSYAPPRALSSRSPPLRSPKLANSNLVVPLLPGNATLADYFHALGP